MRAIRLSGTIPASFIVGNASGEYSISGSSPTRRYLNAWSWVWRVV